MKLLQEKMISDLNDFEDNSVQEDRRNYTNHKLIATETIPDVYILHTAGTYGHSFNIALGLSDTTCLVYNIDNCYLTKLHNLTSYNEKIIGCKFSNDNKNLLYTGSNDGSIKLWDLRAPGNSVGEFTDTAGSSKNYKKLFNCFDLSNDGKLLAAGTDLCGDDTFVLFWDVRKIKLLGGYWESHTDDITQVKFNENSDGLISGSTDGLINIYDITQRTEEDALVDTINTESSVALLECFKDSKNQDCICCVSHTHSVQLWRREDTIPYCRITRLDVMKSMRQKSEAHCYIAGTHQYSPNEALILAGTLQSNSLKCIQTKEKSFSVVYNLKENKQIVRSSWFNAHLKILLTGGEEGVLNVWNL